MFESNMFNYMCDVTIRNYSSKESSQRRIVGTSNPSILYSMGMPNQAKALSHALSEYEGQYYILYDFIQRTLIRFYYDDIVQVNEIDTLKFMETQEIIRRDWMKVYKVA